MKILQLTPGTGSFLCGSCLRDNALATALMARGHDVTISPLYLPFVLEEGGAGAETGRTESTVHMGGINVYLEQKLPWLKLPRFLADRLDRPGLLRFLAARANMTGASELGEMTLSMLRGEEGRQKRELDKLIEWIVADPAGLPDVVLLSNAMLLGMARRLTQVLDRPVVCTLQGEAPFLDSLGPPYAERCWTELAERARDAAGLIAVSSYTADLMAERMRIERERIEVVLNGVELDGGLEPAATAPREPTIGYLARLCEDKGIVALVDAFLALHERGNVPNARLLAGGVMLGDDERLVARLEARLREAGLAERAAFRPNMTRAEKLELLHASSVLSVPAGYGESFGLYVVEALACGVPVVQPDCGGFPEIVERTGGGVLFPHGDVAAHAEALERLLLDDERRTALGRVGREVVRERFSSARMAAEVETLLGDVAAGAAAQRGAVSAR